MQKLREQLISIEEKVNALLEKCTALEGENGKLKEENKALVNNLDQLKREKEEVENQLAEAQSDNSAQKEAENERIRIKKELGQHIKEIDKCILMMGDI